MLTSDLQNRIKEILRPYRAFSPLELAKHLNIEVAFVTPPEDDFCGAIHQIEGKYTIYLNENQHPNRQLFTLAHEIGHYFLHRDQLEAGIVSYRNSAYYSKYNDEEREREEQANHFAAELLMPEDIFRDYFYSNRSQDREAKIKKASEFFEVSEDAVRVRVSYLNMAI